MKQIAFILVSLGLVAAMVVGCGSAAVTPTQTGTPTRTTAATAASPTVTARPTTTAASTLTPQYGGVFRMGTPAGLTKLVAWNQKYDGRILRASYDTLLRFDENYQYQPWLATDWKFGSDYKSLTLTLRKGVKFHDGTDFNATAVKWNLQMRKDAKLGDYENVSSMDVLDDYTLRLNLTKFQNTLLDALWYISGMIHSPTAYDKYGPAQSEWNPVGTGPFKFVSYETNQSVNYTRFDGYWQKGKPYFDAYVCKVIVDPTTLGMAFQAGELDTAQQIPAKTIAELKTKGYNILIGSGSTGGTFWVGDTANADSPWANQKVREAAHYAVNFEEIAKSLGYGLMEAFTVIAPSSSYAYVPGLGRAYDPAKAEKLLTEAGYPNGFKTTLTLNTKDYSSERQAVVAYFKTVGIEVQVDLVDMARMYSNMQFGWKNGLVDKSLGGTDWMAVINLQLSNDAIYVKSWTRPEGLQVLIDKGLEARDAATKKAAAQDIVKLIDKGAYALPLWNSQSSSAYPLQKNVTIHNNGWIPLWGATKDWSPCESWFGK